MEGMTKEFLIKVGKFTQAVLEATTEMDKEVEFICPICGKKAYAFRTSYNGHRSGHCTGCGMNMRE